MAQGPTGNTQTDPPAPPAVAWLRPGGWRAWAPWLPVPRLRSDIAGAVYVNWLAPAHAIAALVPAPLQLQRVGPAGQWAVLTVVAFRHGHFGPRAWGPLRRLAPSPVQSNWRTYVTSPAGRRGVYFLATTVSHPLYALAARLTADNVSMRQPRRNRVAVTAEEVSVDLSPGRGYTPSLVGHWHRTAPSSGPWPGPAPQAGPVRPGAAAARAGPEATGWGAHPASAAFSSAQAMCAFVVPQDCELAVRDGRVVFIDLRLDVPATEPLQPAAPVACSLQALAPGQPPWAFLAPRVRLDYRRQRTERTGAP